MLKNKLAIVVASAILVLASCDVSSIPSSSLSSSSQPTSSIAPSSSSSVSSSSSSSAVTSSSSVSSSVSSSSVSSSQTQPLIPVLATIKGSYANLIVSTFVKSGTNRIYIVRLTNPAVAPNPPVSVTKLVITNASTILFEKDLTPANSSTPSFTGAILFDDNTLLLNYFLSSTRVYTVASFNLTTRVETIVGNVRINIVPDANFGRPLLKDKKFVLTGTIGSSHGIFRLNNDLTTTLIQAVPQAYIGNFYIRLSPNYNFPFIYGYGDNGSSGMNYVPPTKSYTILLKTTDFSMVMEGERDQQYPRIGTELNVNFFTNAISIRKTVAIPDPNNANNPINTNTIHVYNMEGVEKVNRVYTSDLIAFSTTANIYTMESSSNTLFFPAAITGLTIGLRNTNTNSSFEFFMYDAALTQTRTFTVTNTTMNLIRIDQLGNVYVLTNSATPNTFTVYGMNGTDYPYTPNAKFVSFYFEAYNDFSNFYSLPISRAPNPLLLELLNDGSVNVIHFLNNQYRVLNAANFGDFSTIYNVSTSLFANNIQYVSVTGYSDSANALIFRSLIINFTANTLIAVTRTYSVNSNTQDNYTYSNGYVVDSVTNRQNSTTTTNGLEFINLATGAYTYAAFTTSIAGYVYFRNFTLNNDGTFLLTYSGNSSGTITGTTSDLTTLTVTTSSGDSDGGGTYTGRFENILNDLDLVFTDTYTDGTPNTPPTNTRAYYVGTNYNGQLSSLTQVVGEGIPTSAGSFQIVSFDETGTANDKLFLYFSFSNTLVDLTQPGFPVLKGYFTTTGFTLIDENFNEIDDFIASSNITFINPFGGF